MSTLALVDHYLTRFLPSALAPCEQARLESFGVPVAFSIHEGADERRWVLHARERQLALLPPNAPATCGFRMSAQTFLRVVEGKARPAMEFMQRRITFEGDTVLALRLATQLSGLFREHPWNGASPTVAGPSPSRDVPLTEHQRRMLALHLDPLHGSPYWVDRAKRLGVRAEQLRTLDDLAAFGAMDRGALSGLPYRSFVPKALLKGPLFIGETGGATGEPATSVWSDADFEAAFVHPLCALLAGRQGEPLRQWMFVGPTGPHPIGRAARLIARRTTGVDPLLVDFDPRWHRRLPPDSLSASRHLAHLLDQAERLLRREQPDALFVTPSVLAALVERGGRALLECLRFVHLGGQSLTVEGRHALASALPRGAELLHGYGNSLFGCVLEDTTAGALHYALPADRHVIRLTSEGALVSDCAEGEWGRLVVHRFHHSMLLLNVVERDEARRVGRHFADPRPVPSEHVAGGVY
jgi:hypothetical protein